MTTSKIQKAREPQLGYTFETGIRRVRAKPFIKWAGGKWQLVPLFAPHFPPLRENKRYFEPFLGGGAVFFHLQHPKSFLSDRNPELVELYRTVRDDVENLIEALRRHRNEEQYYYKIRSQDSALLSPVQRSARFIFLNKTCYNGLYRVNSKFQFNVPFGRNGRTTLCDAEGLRAASLALQHAEIRESDFETAVSIAQAEDFIYFDPPYQPISGTSSFTSYTAEGFDEREQERLARIFCDLDRRGCYVMLSNSNTPLVRDLYKGFRIVEIQAKRAINCKANGRGKITELLITNYQSQR